MTETWRPIAGYEGYYEVSDYGRVRSIRYANKLCFKPRAEPKILSQRITAGYNRITLCKLNKKRSLSVHVLVLEAFVGPKPEGKESSHRDGNAQNNRADNLRWATHAENLADKNQHGTAMFGEACPSSKLTEEQVRWVRSELANGKSRRSIARELRVWPTTIDRIALGQNWKRVA